jgi:hypothetical protein
MIASCFSHITPLCDHMDDATPASIVQESRASSIDKKSIPVPSKNILYICFMYSRYARVSTD